MLSLNHWNSQFTEQKWLQLHTCKVKTWYSVHFVNVKMKSSNQDRKYPLCCLCCIKEHKNNNKAKRSISLILVHFIYVCKTYISYLLSLTYMKIVKKYLINLDAIIFPAKRYTITAFFLVTFYYYSATKSRSTHYKAVCFSV